MSVSKNYLLPLSNVMARDLPKGYFFPFIASTYNDTFWLRNSKQYQRFDSKYRSVEYTDTIVPQRILPVFGKEVPVLLDQEPSLHLSEHWRKWMPDFANPVLKEMKDGLADENPIMTFIATEWIPPNKHFVHPDLLYKLQLKSTLLEIGVPCPKHYQENGDIEFPCFVKVDQSSGGLGVTRVQDQNELITKLKSIREEFGWKGGIVIQECIKDVIEVPSFNFYLSKSGEMVWLGTALSGFTSFRWDAASANWDKQDHYFNLGYKEFTKPIVKFLTEKGYFGFVNFELVVTKSGKYLVDLNPRLVPSMVHLTAARYMAGLGFEHSYFHSAVKVKHSGREMVEMANNTNASGAGRIIILASEDLENGSMICFSVFGKTVETARALRDKVKDPQ